MALLAFGDVEIDLDRYEIRRNGDVVPTEPQVFDVLVHLATNADRVVTKEELLDAVWGDRFVSESTLTSRIKAARRCVGDDGQRQQVIATVHGRGYRMVTPVRMHSGPEPGPPVADHAGQVGVNELVERDDALAQLTTALAAAASSAGRVVCITGEAGIGKTALVHWLATALGDRATVLIGACDDLTTPRPMAPLYDVAAGLTAAGHPPLDGVGSEVILDAAGVLARDKQRPVVIVLEDLHWADDGTLDAVRYLARRIRAAPLVLVVTYREEDVSLTHPLRSVLGLLRGPGVVRIPLEPLSEAGVGQLAAGAAVGSEELFAVTGGNPFFVTEMLAATVDAVPTTVKDVVLARLTRLPHDAMVALRRLSVVPGRTERWLAVELSDGDEAPLGAAERVGMLDGSAGQVWFRHELARRAVEGTLTSFERVRWNALVAGLLAERGESASRVVHHAALAGDAELVVRAGTSAAAEAIAAGAHRQAVDHLNTVLRHRDSFDERQYAGLLIQQANSLYLVNRFEESLRAAEEAVKAAEEIHDPKLIAQAEIALSRTVLWARGPNASQLAARRAIAVLGPGGDPELRAIAYADLARALGQLTTIGSIAEGNKEALSAATRALSLARELKRDDLAGYALIYVGCERLALGDTAGARDLETAISNLRFSPQAEFAVRACVNAAGAAYRSARFDDAEHFVELGIQLAKETDFTSGEYRLALTRAAVRFSRGRWPEARRELESLLALGGEPGIMGPLARALLARLLARVGESDAAGRTLGPAIAAAAGSDEIRLVGPVTIARVELAWLAGNREDLIAVAEPVLLTSTTPGGVVNRGELGRYLQRAGYRVPELLDVPEPWRSGLAGDWRNAAARWESRGEPYEQALDLISGGHPPAVEAGAAILRNLGAVGAYHLGQRVSHSG
ncbi:MAG TPA: AAA family ATPase [Jiangellales bacterium]|nr:AAA family ATPase [Jiangellales bacterium]